MPEETIKLEQFLKLAGAVRTGGEAKRLIQAGLVFVNSRTATRRGRKLRHGDVVPVEGEEIIVLVEKDKEDDDNKDDDKERKEVGENE